ncbi:MAG: cation:dicarboxylase symporter family transporter [Alphaproteobacteria bacterium]
MFEMFSKKILLSNILYLIAFFGGAFVGARFSEVAPYMENFSNLLQNLFQMCVLPIIVCSITVGVYTLVNSGQKIQLHRLMGVILLICFVICSVGMGIGFIGHPGFEIDLFSNPEIASTITKASIMKKHVWEAIEQASPNSFIDLLKKSIPENVFFSLAENKVLQVIVFSIIFGLSLSKVKGREVVTENFSVLYEAFKKIFSWVLLLLPLSIFCSAAAAISKIGLPLFIKLFPFLKYLFLCIFIIFTLNLLALKYMHKTSFYKLLKDLKLSLVVGFVSSPLAATLPVTDFLKKYKSSGQVMHTLTPIFLFMGTFGNVLYFVFTSMVITQIYGHNFGVVESLFLDLFSIIAAISSIGVELDPSVFLESVLSQLGVPLGSIVVLLTNLSFIVIPFLNILSTQTTIVLLSWFTKEQKHS